jgi:hypothetical protein
MFLSPPLEVSDLSVRFPLLGFLFEILALIGSVLALTQTNLDLHTPLLPIET